MSFIKSLTGIRAIAALWVLVGHYSSYLNENFGLSRTTPLQPLIGSAWAGVDLFFVLSGFIITHTYLHNFNRRGLSESPRFWWKRIARLYPVYLTMTLVATCFYLIAVMTGHHFRNESAVNLSPTVFVANIFGVQQWLGLPSLDGPAWSVSAEIFAYLMFPLIALSLLRIESRPLLVCFTIFAAALLLVDTSRTPINPRIWQVTFEFTLGALIYKASRGVDFKYAIRFATPLRATLWFASLTIIYAAGVHAAEWHAPLAAAFALLILLYSLDGQERSPLAGKTFFTLGLWSYSLYLVHRLLQNVTSGIGVPTSSHFAFNALIFMILLLIPIGLSGLTYTYIEEPSRKYLNERPWLRRRAATTN